MKVDDKDRHRAREHARVQVVEARPLTSRLFSCRILRDAAGTSLSVVVKWPDRRRVKNGASFSPIPESVLDNVPLVSALRPDLCPF